MPNPTSYPRWLALGKRLIGVRRLTGLTAVLLAVASFPLSNGPKKPLLLIDPGLSGSISSAAGSGQPADPLQFSPDELKELQRRFGVHGPQPRLAQLFTSGIDQFEPLRSYTLGRLVELAVVQVGQGG